MKNIKDLLYNGLISGLIGIGIGTIWMAMDFLFSLNGQNPATAKIPVILITAEFEEESREKGISLGAVDFINKPFEPQVLLNRIEAVWKEEE